LTRDICFLSDLKQIDGEYLKINLNSRQSKAFYLLLEKNNTFVNAMFIKLSNNLEKNKFLRGYLNHISMHVINGDYSKFKILNDKNKISIAIIVCAVV
jgi:hypothetical protein